MISSLHLTKNVKKAAMSQFVFDLAHSWKNGHSHALNTKLTSRTFQRNTKWIKVKKFSTSFDVVFAFEFFYSFKNVAITQSHREET